MESQTVLLIFCFIFISFSSGSHDIDPCADAHRNPESCHCWPSSVPGIQSEPLSWHDGTLTLQFTCPRGLVFPRGSASFYGNCTADMKCLRVPPCKETFSCDFKNPCLGGRHAYQQFLHDDRGRFVACGPREQCIQMFCPGGLDFDEEQEYCTWTV